MSNAGAMTSKTASALPTQVVKRLLPVAVTSSIPRVGAQNRADRPNGLALAEGSTGVPALVVNGVNTSALRRHMTDPGRMSKLRPQLGSRKPPYDVAWCAAHT